MYKLACNGDARALGIENERGDWDMSKFEAHIKECAICACVVTQLKREISEALSGRALEGAGRGKRRKE